MMRQSRLIQPPSDRLLSLSTTLDALLRHKRAGDALPECYGDEIGAKTWAGFTRVSDPGVQYTFGSEVSALHNGMGGIVSIIKNDADLDLSSLIVIEKGGGDIGALDKKSFAVLRDLIMSGVFIDLYSGWEKSREYRNEGAAFARKQIGDVEISMQDVDFNTDNPDISTAKFKDVERPRLVLEFGSSRGNIATSLEDDRPFHEQTYHELRRRFRHDRLICRDGGVLLMGTDANNTPSARTAYIHPAHAKFSENIVHRGLREGALADNFEPQLFYYDPVWSEDDHVVRHTLFAIDDQETKILNPSGHFNHCSIVQDAEFVFSHSIKWPVDKVIMAAKAEGFKCLGVFWGDDRKVPIYLFKAVSFGPDIKLVR